MLRLRQYDMKSYTIVLGDDGSETTRLNGAICPIVSRPIPFILPSAPNGQSSPTWSSSV